MTHNAQCTYLQWWHNQNNNHHLLRHSERSGSSGNVFKANRAGLVRSITTMTCKSMRNFFIKAQFVMKTTWQVLAWLEDHGDVLWFVFSKVYSWKDEMQLKMRSPGTCWKNYSCPSFFSCCLVNIYVIANPSSFPCSGEWALTFQAGLVINLPFTKIPIDFHVIDLRVTRHRWHHDLEEPYTVCDDIMQMTVGAFRFDEDWQYVNQ